MSATITHNEQTFINFVLLAGYPRNDRGGFDTDKLAEISPKLFPKSNTPGYSDVEYRTFRETITGSDQASSKRYGFSNNMGNARKDAMDALFNKAFKDKAKEVVIRAAETASNTQFYSPWKKAFVIDLPWAVGHTLSSPIVKMAIGIATLAIATKALSSIYEFSSAFVHSAVMPPISFVVAQFPEHSLFITDCAAKAIDFARANYQASFLASWGTFYIVRQIYALPGAPPIVRRIASIVQRATYLISVICATLMPKSPDSVILSNAFDSGYAAFRLAGGIGGELINQAETAQEHRQRVCKEKAYAVWIKIIEKTATPAIVLQNAI